MFAWSRDTNMDFQYHTAVRYGCNQSTNSFCFVLFVWCFSIELYFLLCAFAFSCSTWIFVLSFTKCTTATDAMNILKSLERKKGNKCAVFMGLSFSNILCNLLNACSYEQPDCVATFRLQSNKSRKFNLTFFRGCSQRFLLNEIIRCESQYILESQLERQKERRFNSKNHFIAGNSMRQMKTKQHMRTCIHFKSEILIIVLSACCIKLQHS